MDATTAANKIISEIAKHKKAKSGPLLVALDGRSGTGKSTISQLVAEMVGGAVVVGDDFYSGGNDDRWEGCSPQTKANEAIDWKRMRLEVLEPLLTGKTASWHPLAFEPGSAGRDGNPNGSPCNQQR
jgi:uridine kinase